MKKTSDHVIVAYASCSRKHFASVKELHSLMESVGQKVKRYGLTKNSKEADFGNNLSHPRFDEKENMKLGIGKFSCVTNPTDRQIQPYCITHLKNKYTLCLYGKTSNLDQIANYLKNTKQSVFTCENSRAEIFLHYLITHPKKNIEESFLKMLLEIKGQYCIAFSVNDENLFLARRGNADPFFISKNKGGNEFLCSSNINSLNEKNIIQITAPWVVIKFTAGNTRYKKIKLK